jgi:DNA-binding NtrC family response regulator
MAKEYAGRVIVVDDDRVVCELLQAVLESNGFDVTIAHDLATLKHAVSQRFYDAVLLDLYIGDEDGLEALPFLAQKAPYTKTIMMSANGTIEVAVTAMDRGASAFVAKSKDATEIVKELLQRLKKSKEAPGSTFVSGTASIIGRSQPMTEVIKRIDRIKDVDSTVLVVGESGTGKEVVARAIHQTSNRKDHRFEAINCAAIPATLLESELFGHKKGAFTDAKVDRKGIFEVCSDGTLLLDEIGEMPVELQAKLLRVLQEKEVTPIGSSRGIKINTRVVAATNKNLTDLVKAGQFREDLYFRLAVLTIELPSLRERKDDIPLLVEAFVQKMNERFNKTIAAPSKELLAKLMGYNWPGNIRELQNAVERGVVLSPDGSLHLEDMIPPAVSSLYEEKNDGLSIDYLTTTLSEAKDRFEKEYLRQLLEMTRGNISEIARISGRYRADIYRLLSKHGVEWEEFRPR